MQTELYYSSSSYTILPVPARRNCGNQDALRLAQLRCAVAVSKDVPEVFYSS